MVPVVVLLFLGSYIPQITQKHENRSFQINFEKNILEGRFPFTGSLPPTTGAGPRPEPAAWNLIQVSHVGGKNLPGSAVAGS